MSFGFSIGDIIACSQLAVQCYNALSDAPEEWEGLRLEFRSLNTSLKTLADEHEAPTSLIYSASPRRQEDLRVLLQDCRQNIEKLQRLVLDFCRFDFEKKRRILERIRFASKDKSGPRDRLALHTASINMFLATLTNSSLGRVEFLLRNARSGGKRAASDAFVNSMAMMTGREGGGAQASSVGKTGSDQSTGACWIKIWKDLSDEGVHDADCEKFEEDIKAYIRFLVNGATPFWKRPHTSQNLPPAAVLDHPQTAIASNTTSAKDAGQDFDTVYRLKMALADANSQLPPQPPATPPLPSASSTPQPSCTKMPLETSVAEALEALKAAAERGDQEVIQQILNSGKFATTDQNTKNSAILHAAADGFGTAGKVMDTLKNGKDDADDVLSLKKRKPRSRIMGVYASMEDAEKAKQSLQSYDNARPSKVELIEAPELRLADNVGGSTDAQLLGVRKDGRPIQTEQQDDQVDIPLHAHNANQSSNLDLTELDNPDSPHYSSTSEDLIDIEPEAPAIIVAPTCRAQLEEWLPSLRSLRDRWLRVATLSAQTKTFASNSGKLELAAAKVSMLEWSITAIEDFLASRSGKKPLDLILMDCVTFETVEREVNQLAWTNKESQENLVKLEQELVEQEEDDMFIREFEGLFQARELPLNPTYST
ncbi:hypothetical protein B0A48_05649 [Cryoendolithus antarcticus]|uniref:Fungal N-terminal domain-containing protein n=1 Tax=Cryoendolithus antarcticus TaxID=1507870 RepID=A0A1V8TJ20_9PEZI|nr:hypothetical protein B0A48_05649 [Cryoendolithus antarcticus]